MKTAYKKSTKNSNNNNNTEPKKDKFIEKILENLDLVNANDWEAYTNIEGIYPTNLFTKKQYNGFNVMALYLDTMIRNFKSCKYATFNSISKAGGRLKKGSKGCVIEFFSFIYKDKDTGKNIPVEQIRVMTLDQLKNINKISCVKNYVVFNSEQIENIDDLNLNIDIEEPQENECNEIENCENFISKIIVNGNLNLKFGTDEIAFYSPTFDYIQLPKKEFFISTAKYYSTLFHEIIHWTGHEKRLSRNMKGHNNKESYSFEELIAEMGAMLNCLQFGIYEEFINSIRYLKGWSTQNKTDRETNLRKAFTESKKAKKYLENL